MQGSLFDILKQMFLARGLEPIPQDLFIRGEALEEAFPTKSVLFCRGFPAGFTVLIFQFHFIFLVVSLNAF